MVSLVFTARHDASEVYAVVVCLSFRHTPKHRITQRKQRRTIALGLVPKISAKFQRGHPQQGAK